MHCSPYVPEQYGPATYMPESVFEHYSNTTYYIENREYLALQEREELMSALNSNEEFTKFWTQIQEQHPAKKEYFLSLLNEDEPFNACWLACEFDTYRQRNAFNLLSEDEQKTLQTDFDELRPADYRVALEAEAKRLNCDIADVKAINLVLPWESAHEEESILARLPNELFGRVFQFLETLDIFKMTLVCQRWRRLIYDNCVELKKTEHAMTTHCIRCTGWMDPAKTPNNEAFLNQYQMFSWCLTRWFCGVAENLEALILDHPVPYTNLADLLQSCPNLKQLRIGYDGHWNDCLSGIVLARVELRKLEVFMASLPDYFHGSVKTSRQLHRDILASSPSLRIYKGPLDSADFFAIDARNPVTNVFSKLVALDLENFTPAAIENLAHIDGVQLKYLRLGSHDRNSELDGDADKHRSRKALHQLLPKLSNLEMLRTSYHIGVTNYTIRLLTDLELNINWTVLYYSNLPKQDDEEDNIISTGKDPSQPEVLTAFRNMLLSKNPDIDLAEIRLVLRPGKTLKALKAMNTGFTIWETNAYGYPPIPVDELYYPKIRQRLEID